jgi:hypothetical protein
MEYYMDDLQVPPGLGEGKRKKFVELAEKRVINALKSISLIGNLANTNNYKYNEADVKKIIKALSDEVKEVESRFKTGRSEDKVFKI